jgi:hypothetical protein
MSEDMKHLPDKTEKPTGIVVVARQQTLSH